jgi:hypothetical protein
MNTEQESQPQPNPHGRTVWDMLAGTFQSKLLFYSFIALIFSIILYFTWDLISIIPIYVISSVILSLFWYNPISSWLSRQSTFIEVWNPDTNTLTTYRAGRDAFSRLQREGITNQVSSLTGNNRIFASGIDLETNTIQTSWVHSLDPWTYHVERRTLASLADRLSNVLDDIIDAESLAQVKGREHAMESMNRHYKDLDSIFFGDTSSNEVEQTIPSQGDNSNE